MKLKDAEKIGRFILDDTTHPLTAERIREIVRRNPEVFKGVKTEDVVKLWEEQQRNKKSHHGPSNP